MPLIQYQIIQPVINLQNRAKKLGIIAIIGEDYIIYQGAYEELNHHQTSRGKSKVKISICRRKIYHKTDLE